MKKVLITGGAGFVGYHLAVRLSENDDCQVHIVDNLLRGKFDPDFKAFLKRKNVKFIKADLTDLKSYGLLDNNYAYIYSLAAIIGVKNVTESPVRTLYVNIVSILNLLEWISAKNKKLKKLLFTSTSEVYAGTHKHYGIPIPTDEKVNLVVENIILPRTTYALSKMVGESACLNYSGERKIPVTIIRYHNVYGPRMGFAHVIPETFVKVSKNTVVEVPSPDHTRAFCFIDEAVDATIRACESPNTANEILHIGNSREEINMRDLVVKIARVMGREITINELPDTPGSTRRRCPDTAKANRLTGYSPNISLEEGIRRTYQWYKDQLNTGKD